MPRGFRTRLLVLSQIYINVGLGSEGRVAAGFEEVVSTRVCGGISAFLFLSVLQDRCRERICLGLCNTELGPAHTSVVSPLSKRKPICRVFRAE